MCKKIFLSLFLSTSICLGGILSNLPTAQAESQRVKIGVSSALTGDAATFGGDIKNALVLFNQKYGNGRYELILEDEKCINRDAVSVANKFAHIDKVKYVLGFPCNSTMFASLPVYQKANITMITSSATSGDVVDVGRNVFRLFPSDAEGAKVVFDYMAKRHKKIAIFTEQNEYPVMVERTIAKANKERTNPVELLSYDFVHGSTNIRSLLFVAEKAGADAIFINANTDTSFSAAVKQIRALKLPQAIYAMYQPASSEVRSALGAEVEGIIFSNLPRSDQLVTERGKELFAQFKKDYGDPKSGFPVVLTSFEAFRILDQALQSGKTPEEFLKGRKITDGFIPDYYFDEHGAVQGIKFEMQKIENGEVVTLER